VLGESACGPCGVRENRGGVLWTRADGRVVKVVPRPVEALGLYHVLPGTRALTVSFADPTAPAGQDDVMARALHSYSTRELPDLARRAGAATVAFGYAEPTFHFEALVPALELARRSGFLTAIQSNGGATVETCARLATLLDAVSIDVPTLVESTARRMGGVPAHALRGALATLRRRGVWCEISTVLVPGVNDSDQELLEIALSLKAIDDTMPWHVRCIPTDERMLARWAETAIERALAAGARAGLDYVYATEAPGSDRELTFCHVCRDVVLIERYLGQPRNLMAEGLRCPRCRTQARGLFDRRAGITGAFGAFGASPAASALP
jgi:pyruvate formate lyase activating enzyme